MPLQVGYAFRIFKHHKRLYQAFILNIVVRVKGPYTRVFQVMVPYFQVCALACYFQMHPGHFCTYTCFVPFPFIYLKGISKQMADT